MKPIEYFLLSWSFNAHGGFCFWALVQCTHKLHCQEHMYFQRYSNGFRKASKISAIQLTSTWCHSPEEDPCYVRHKVLMAFSTVRCDAV